MEYSADRIAPRKASLILAAVSSGMPFQQYEKEMRSVAGGAEKCFPCLEWEVPPFFLPHTGGASDSTPVTLAAVPPHHMPCHFLFGKCQHTIPEHRSPSRCTRSPSTQIPTPYSRQGSKTLPDIDNSTRQSPREFPFGPSILPPNTHLA